MWHPLPIFVVVSFLIHRDIPNGGNSVPAAIRRPCDANRRNIRFSAPFLSSYRAPFWGSLGIKAADSEDDRDSDENLDDGDTDTTRRQSKKSELEKKRRDFLKKRFQLNDDEIDKMVRVQAKLLYGRLQPFEQRAEWLKQRLELDDREMKLLICQNPSILTSTVATLEGIISFFEQRLNMKRNKVLISMKLQRIANAETLESNYQSLKSMLDIEEIFIEPNRTKTICRNNPLLLMSSTSTLDMKKEWLKKRLSLNDEEFAKMILRNPPLWQKNMENNIDPKLAWLQSRFRLNDKSLRTLVCSQPLLLGLNEASSEKKIQFYIDLLGEEEAIQMCAHHSFVMTRSLENCMQPRIAEALELGMGPLDARFVVSLAMTSTKRWSHRVQAFKKTQQEQLMD